MGDGLRKAEIRLPIRLVLTIIVIVLLPLVADRGAVYADEPSVLWGRTVSSIEVRWSSGQAVDIRSPSPIPLEELARRTGLAPGRAVTRESVRKALDLFYSKEAIKQVILEGHQDSDRVRLTITLVKRIRIVELLFDGNHNATSNELMGAANVKIGDEYAEEIWKKTEGLILSYYSRRGYFDAQIDTRMEPSGEGKGILHIQIGEGEVFRVSGVTLEGQKGLSDKTLKKALNLDKGDPFIRGELESGVKEIEALYVKEGYVDARVGTPRIDIHRDSKKVTVAVPVKSGPRYRVVFIGNRHLSDGSLKQKLLIWEERSVDGGVLQDSARRIEGLYEEKGYPFSKVRYEIRTPESDTTDQIVFDIQEGPKMWVRSITFAGNRAYTDDKLRGLMRVKVRNRFLFRSGILVESDLDKDAADIQSLYRGSGYLSAEVRLQRSEDRSHPFDVTVTVDEGVQTRIGEIDITGNLNADRGVLMKAITLAPGQPYSEAKGREAGRAILIPYSKQGYVYAESSLKERYREDRELVDLQFSISEGEPVKVGSIAITGNKKTRNFVIRRELLVNPGDPYDYEKILKSQQALYQVGLFRQVRFEPTRPDVKEPVKDMVVTVQDRPSGRIDFGLGYADVERMRGFVEIGYANIFGTARSISSRAEISQISQKYTLSYKEPWVFNLRLDGRASSIFAVEKFTSFERRTVGGTIGLDKNWTRALKTSLSYQFENVKPFNVDPSAILTVEDSRKVYIASLNPSLIWDRRDDPFNPTAGFIQGFTVKDAAQTLGSRSQFVKASAQSSWFYSPIRRIVLALSARGGWATNFGESSELPITERFFLGGRSTVRGYSQDRLGINTETIINGTPTGGNMMILLNGEIRITLPYDLGLVLFSDSGGVWLKSEDVSPDGMRTTIGAGLRYNTPVGPIRLDVGRKLRRHRFDVGGIPPTTVGESVYELHFTLGQAF